MRSPFLPRTIKGGFALAQPRGHAGGGRCARVKRALKRAEAQVVLL